MGTYELGKYRIVDLTKFIDPDTEKRRCHLFRYNTGGYIPDYHTLVDITTHLGTHVEGPYHHNNDWPDISQLPLNLFMGRGIYVNITDCEPNTYINSDVLDRWVLPRMKENDVVIIDSPYKLEPFTEKTNTDDDKRLFINGETGEWLLKHKAKCIGFGEGVSIEKCNEDCAPFHDVCLSHNITFLEVLKNLEELQQDTFFISYAPLLIKGLDSCPVRVYAIEGLADFS